MSPFRSITSTKLFYNIYTSAYSLYEKPIYKIPSTEQTPVEAQILAKFSCFLDNANIRKDLKIKESTALGISAQGSNLPRFGDAVIHASTKLHQTDPLAFSFVLKHEIAHIKYNDTLTINALKAVSLMSQLALIFCSSESRITNATILALALGIPISIYRRYREGRADDFAIANSSIDELKAGRRFFKAYQQLNLETYQKHPFFYASPQGENRIDFKHPSLQSRIQKIEKVLKTKNTTINEIEEQEKIEQLKASIRKNCLL